jgi:hypothetical protein
MRAALLRHRQMDGSLPAQAQFAAFLRQGFDSPRGDPSRDWWGRPYRYAVHPDGRGFHLGSFGPDGRPDTGDDITVRWEERG